MKVEEKEVDIVKPQKPTWRIKPENHNIIAVMCVSPSFNLSVCHHSQSIENSSHPGYSQCWWL